MNAVTSDKSNTSGRTGRLPFSSRLGEWWSERRLEGEILRSGGYYEPLHGDKTLKSLMDEIVQNWDATAFVETGTFVGDTAKYVALRYPNVKVFTCEINKRWLKLAKRFCEGISNIEFFQGQSPEFLDGLRDFLKGERPIFWLDAHWGDYWPLVGETKLISSLPRYVIMIDDFEVPGRPRFHYDVYNGVKNSLQLHSNVLGGRCYVPNYEPDPTCRNPAGYGVFFKGVECSKLDSIGSLRELVVLDDHLGANL